MGEPITSLETLLSGFRVVSQSGWDKRQAIVQLTVFADAVPRVLLLVFFRGKGVGVTILTEMKLYDPRVIVKFNPKAYANTENLLQWLDEQVIPVLEINQPSWRLTYLVHTKLTMFLTPFAPMISLSALFLVAAQDWYSHWIFQLITPLRIS